MIALTLHHGVILPVVIRMVDATVILQKRRSFHCTLHKSFTKKVELFCLVDEIRFGIVSDIGLIGWSRISYLRFPD